MATVILGAIKANSFWHSVLVLAGNFIDQKLFSTTTKIEGQRLQDLRFQTSSYGAVIPKVYGTTRVAGNVIWSTNFVEHKTTTSHRSGGKGGGGSKTETTAYDYSISLAIQICKGPIKGIGRVWLDGKLAGVNHTGSWSDGKTGTVKGAAFTLYFGTETQTSNSFMEAHLGVGNVPAYRGTAYIVIQNMYLTDFGNRVPQFTFEVIGVESNLKTIVEEISTESGLSNNDVVATDLADTNINGYSIESISSGRNQIEPLQLSYTFDAAENSGKVVFFKRTFQNPVSIPYEDTGATENNKIESLKIIREDEMEIPRRINIKYLSVDFDYQEQQMSGKRASKAFSRNELDVTLGLALNDAYVKQLADTKLFEAWINRNTFETFLPTKYANLMPGSSIIIEDFGGNKHSAIVTKTSFGKPGIVKVSAVTASGTTYEQVSRTVDPGASQQVGESDTEIISEFLDLPKLPQDPSTAAVAYFAATATVYHGASVYRAVAGGADYHLLGASSLQAVIGNTTTLLKRGPTEFWDNANSVIVKVFGAALESHAEEEVLNGANLAVIGNEIIQYANVTIVAENTYKLTKLLRGRLGTEDQVNVHAIGDRFVSLSSTSVTGLAVSQSEWYVDRTYKCGPMKLPITDPLYKDITFTYNARRLQPFAVCHVKGKKLTNNDILITWIRRTRYDGEWKDLTDVALNETSEKFEVEIMAEATVKRVIASTQQQITYPSELQVQDFGTSLSNVTVRIYQLSELRGRGIAKEVTIQV